jgi:hypothetical protein
MKKANTKKGDTPMRVKGALVIEPAQSWKRLQDAKEFFIPRPRARFQFTLTPTLSHRVSV